MSYWDIDDFLAQQQKIQSHFTKQAKGMQFLDPTKGHNGNLQANQEFQTAIWALNTINLYLPQMQQQIQDYLKVTFPSYLHSKQFQNRVNSFLISSRSSSIQKVNFQKQSTYFYQTYLCLKTIMNNQATVFDRGMVGKLLQQRGKYILIRASAYVGDINVDMALNTYTDFQTRIYKHTKNAIEQSNAWKYSHKWFDNHNSLKKKTNK